MARTCVRNSYAFGHMVVAKSFTVSLLAYHVLASVELLPIVSAFMTCDTSVPALVLCHPDISNQVPRFLWQDVGVTYKTGAKQSVEGRSL